MAIYSFLSWFFKFFKSNLPVIAALWIPKVSAANDIEGLLNIKSIKIIIGGGIKRNRNDIDLIIMIPILLLNNNIKTGGKLTAIPVDNRLKTIVSNNSLKKSYEMKLEFDINILLIKFKGIVFLFNIKWTMKNKENKLIKSIEKTKEIKKFLEVWKRFIFFNSAFEIIIKKANPHR